MFLQCRYNVSTMSLQNRDFDRDFECDFDCDFDRDFGRDFERDLTEYFPSPYLHSGQHDGGDRPGQGVCSRDEGQGASGGEQRQ